MKTNLILESVKDAQFERLTLDGMRRLPITFGSVHEVWIRPDPEHPLPPDDKVLAMSFLDGIGNAAIQAYLQKMFGELRTVQIPCVGVDPRDSRKLAAWNAGANAAQSAIMKKFLKLAKGDQ